jgi:ribosomal protein S18 acetylase RimI-like enzyme
MTIRPATTSDLENLRKLNSIIFIDNPKYDDDTIPNFAHTPTGKKYFQQAITKKDGCCFIAEDNDQLLGYINGSALDLPYRKSRYIEIENLGVIPSQQGTGLAQQLLDTITNWAKQHGYQKVYVESYIKNQRAVNFYHKHGFQDIDLSLEKKI